MKINVVKRRRQGLPLTPGLNVHTLWARRRSGTIRNASAWTMIYKPLCPRSGPAAVWHRLSRFSTLTTCCVGSRLPGHQVRIPAIAASRPSLTPHSVSAPGSTARGGWPILLFYSAPDDLPTKSCPDLPFAWSPLCFHPLPLPHALLPPTSLTPLTPTWQESLKWMDLLHKSLSLCHRIILYVSRLDLAPYVTGRSGTHPKARISVPS